MSGAVVNYLIALGVGISLSFLGVWLGTKLLVKIGPYIKVKR